MTMVIKWKSELWFHKATADSAQQFNEGSLPALKFAEKGYPRLLLVPILLPLKI